MTRNCKLYIDTPTGRKYLPQSKRGEFSSDDPNQAGVFRLDEITDLFELGWQVEELPEDQQMRAFDAPRLPGM